MKQYIPLVAWEKTLLHLMNYSKTEEKFEAPIEITQEGISRGTLINHPHIPRAIQTLQKKDFVIEKRKNIKGKKQRMKSYYLTNNGMSFAIDLVDKLNRKKIVLVEQEGTKRDINISQYLRKLEIQVTILELIRNISYDGKINNNEFIEEIKRLRSKFIFFTENVPKHKYFCGRMSEILEIKKLIKSHKVVFIQGIPGIGKTTFGIKLIEDYKSSKNLFWYQIHEWNTVSGFLDSFSEFLFKLNKSRLKLYLKNNKSIDMNEISNIIESDLKDTNTLLIFDDLQKTEKSISMFFSMLIDLITNMKNVNILFLGRHLPTNKIYDSLNKNIAEFTLKGLDFNSSMELLESKNVILEKDELNKIYELLEGHPLFLELMSAIENFDISLIKEKDIKRFIQEEIYLKLTEHERLALELISVFRYPIESSVLVNEPGLTYESLDDLTEKSLIEEVGDEKYDAHDWIKEYFYSRLKPQTKLSYHERAAEYYITKNIDIALIEGPYHYLKAEKRNTTIKFIIQNSKNLLKRGYFEELKELINELDKEDKEISENDKILLIKGQTEFGLGELDKAINNYKKVLEISFNEEIRASAYSNLGYILQEKGELEKALESYEDALEISERINDYQGIVDANRGIGYIYTKKGIFEGAILYYNECIDYAKKVGDISSNAEAQFDLGIVYESKNDIEKALEFFNTSLKLLEALGDEYQKIRVFEKLSKIYCQIEDWDNSIKYFDESINVENEIGTPDKLASKYYDYGNMYKIKGEKNNAKKYFEMALDIYIDINKENDIKNIKNEIKSL